MMAKPSRERMILAVAALWAVGSGASASPLPPPRPVAVIKLQPYAGQLWSFQARLNGRSARFLFDTAGGMSIITPAAAQTIGCTPWGRLTGFRMRGDRLDMKRCEHLEVEVGGLRLRVPTVGVWDLMKVAPEGAPMLDGLVALDAFAGRAITLDLARGRLVVESPGSLRARVRGMTPIRVSYGREVEGLGLVAFAAATTPRGDAWMELDSGSDGPAVVATHSAGPLGLDPTSKAEQALELVLAGKVKTKVRARVVDLIYDGNIGEPTLRKWVVTFDMIGQRLWIFNRGEMAASVASQ